MTTDKKKIIFGFMMQGPGDHMNAWKHPSAPVDASVNFDYYLRTTQQAEAAGIAIAFIADGLYINEQSIPHFLNRFEPVTILSALAAVTQKIGLVGTVSTSYSDPYTVARQFASLDLISRGRAGWNAVTSPLDGSARNYSRTHPEHSVRYQIAEEHLDVVKGLWDSWDDDAFVRDRESGVYVDKTRLRRVNYQGKYFSVEGPLNVQRSAQGQPVVFQAGASEAGIRLAGRHADAVFTDAGVLEDNQKLYQKLKASAVSHGRHPDELKVLPGIGPIVGETDEEAEAKYQVTRGLVTDEEALLFLGRFFDHHDFSQYPLDAPFPELGSIGDNNFRSTTARIKANARARNLTLREAALDAASPRSRFIGSAENVANELIRWIDNGAADGFILGLQVIPQGLDDFTRLVIPILEARGYYDRVLKGNTLRENLGLPYKESRYAAQACATGDRP